LDLYFSLLAPKAVKLSFRGWIVQRINGAKAIETILLYHIIFKIKVFERPLGFEMAADRMGPPPD